MFGSYVEAHDDTTVTNNMNPRTHKFISLGPTRNLKGTQKVFCPKIERVLKKIKIIPMVGRSGHGMGRFCTIKKLVKN